MRSDERFLNSGVKKKNLPVSLQIGDEEAREEYFKKKVFERSRDPSPIKEINGESENSIGKPQFEKAIINCDGDVEKKTSVAFDKEAHQKHFTEPFVYSKAEEFNEEHFFNTIVDTLDKIALEKNDRDLRKRFINWFIKNFNGTVEDFSNEDNLKSTAVRIGKSFRAITEAQETPHLSKPWTTKSLGSDQKENL